MQAQLFSSCFGSWGLVFPPLEASPIPGFRSHQPLHTTALLCPSHGAVVAFSVPSVACYGARSGLFCLDPHSEWKGLTPTRTFNMLTMIPHDDIMPSVGQRFDSWNSLVYCSPSRIKWAQPFTPLRGHDGHTILAEPLETVISSSGSRNVRGSGLLEYIDKVAID